MDINFAEFHFLRPWWLLAILPAMLFLWLLIKNKQARGSWTEVCDAEFLPFLLDDKPLSKSRDGLIAGSLACLLTITAIAGPTWQRLPSPAFRNDAALVIALDLSASMDATDIKPSRIAKARYKIADLLKQRKDGQTALLVYGGAAFTVTPLTNDTATIASQLEALNTDIMPSPGTDTGIAIHKAVDLLQQAGVAQGHILLISDGVDNNSADLVADWLGRYRLSVLAVGTPEGAPIQQVGGGFIKDAGGNIVLAKLDTEALRKLAQHGKGVYQAVTTGDEDVDSLSKIFNTVKGDEKNQDGNLLLQQWDEKGPYLLLLVLPWAVLQFRRGVLMWGILLLLPWPKDSMAWDWQSLWQNPNQQAQQAFNQQQYQQAAEQFQNPDWRAAAQYKAGDFQQAAETLKNSNTVEGLYNRGNALAQAGQLSEALAAYNQALKLNPEHQDARFNKEIVEKKLKEQEQKKEQNPQNDKQDQADKDQQKSEQKSAQDKQQNQQQAEDKNQSAQNQDKQKEQQSSKSQQQQADDKQESADEAQQQEATKQQANQGKKDDSQKNDKQAAEPKTASELEQRELEISNEQLLKRIPDEPTGLLKRKFRYQYSQHNKSAPTNPGW